MSDYTPTTVEIRNKYAKEWIEGEYFGIDIEALAEFDRWLLALKEAAYWEGYGDGQDSMWVE